MMSAILYLSQELQGMGLSCPLIETGSQRVNLVALVNACWEVTQLYRSSIRDTNTLYDQRRRDASDINHFQSSVRDLKGSVEEKERLVCDAQEKERQALTFTKTLAAKLRAEKEEVRKLSSVLQQREAQHQHELRKKEVEHNRLIDRLHRMVSGGAVAGGDKFSSDNRTTPTMSLSSKLTRHNSTRAKWKTDSSIARHEEDLQRRILGQYECWVGQLNDENEQLKSFLSSTSTQIGKLVTRFAKSEGQTMLEGHLLNTSFNSSTYSSDSLENVVVSLEFPAFRDQMQRSFDHNIKILTNLLKQNSSDRSLGEVLDETQLKKDILDSTVKGQQSLCSTLKKKEEEQQQHTDDDEDGEEGDPSFVVDGRDVEERLSLDKTREEVCMEKRLLHEEKERFTEATIRLNRERASFEAEKVELLRRQFLQDLPSTLSDSGRDLATINNTHESGESVVNIGSLLGEGYDSPHRGLLSAVPNLTSPQGNITYLQGFPLPVLGPTKLPSQQQQQQHFSDTKKGWRSSRRL
ncbi:hypothetical protein Pcinc_030764 [Petrolisthes cinctipes]|nr:hypothetical protein Pcinc_030764 [Petrolisthes cinctipes]